MKYTILTHGCQMNEYDSRHIGRILTGDGHESVDSLDQAELIILNTCSIRDSAEQRIHGRIGEMKRYKNRGVNRVLGICGCMAQKEAHRLTERHGHIDFVVGTYSWNQIPAIVHRLESGHGPIIEVSDETDPFEQLARLPSTSTGGEVIYPMFVSIMRGCDNHCAYCVVPSVRGPEVCRSPEEIIQEVESLAAAGYREVTLLGQNVNSYQYEKLNFPGLLRKINQLEGLVRVRFMTSHPKDITPELVDTVAELDKVCEHFHFAMQAGSDRVLEMMNRKYTGSEYGDKVKLIRNRFKNKTGESVAITTDLIVGFPGETEADFEQTMEWVNKIRWDGAYTFKYSPRRETPAATMPDQVPEPEKIGRLEKLIETQHQISREANDALIGQTLEIMAEEQTDNRAGKRGETDRRPASAKEFSHTYRGRTRGSRQVFVQHKGERPAVSELRQVKIIGATSYTLFAEE